MVLTGAERVKLWRERQKSDPRKYGEYLQKERNRYKDKKISGVVKPIEDMTEREQRRTRKHWRKHQANKRERMKQAIETNNFLANNTPPVSPENGEFQQNIRRTNAQRRGRKKVRKDRSKAYRQLRKLSVRLISAEKLNQRYRQRLHRMKNKGKLSSESPRSKTNILLKKQNVSPKVRKTLLYHFSLVEGIKQKYRDNKSEKKRQLIRNVVKSNILKKYRFKHFTEKTFSFCRKTKTTEHLEYTRKQHKNKTVTKFLKMVREFLQRDENSRCAAGKKETITRNKIKMQKSYLNDDLRHLHEKFYSEFPEHPVSYLMFCKCRPFWIVKPSTKDRETCLCIKHENIHYLIEKLYQSQLITTNRVETIIDNICCDIANKNCMYRQCDICEKKEVGMNEQDLTQQVSWYKWCTRREEKVKNDSTVTISTTVKVEETGVLGHLIDEFQESLKKFCYHYFNIVHQYQALKRLKENLNDNEVVIHMDFSENFNCKYEKEIQSVHFGASQRSISLHTGLVYHQNKVLFSFCSISDCKQHNPAAIWAHLTPVLKKIKEKIGTIDTVYFVSDGPTTQYRNKQNFYLLCTYFFTIGFKVGNWNFLEAGHGKRAADGIGAAVKRTLIGQVLNDSNTSVQLFLVEDEDVDAMNKLIPDSLKPIPQTMKIHQVFCQEQHNLIVQSRHVSWFCKKPEPCDCFGVSEFQFDKSNATNIQSDSLDHQSLENGV
ncbi:unnamed protein product [Mytilus coruscus]|uniref:Uncharacterized protein n=1 Tax=Mytilus coruscus TaxID=42192 RepID=A0A6J8B5U2_MYTCO|nr:unnamed protein product [Mytilus coruscus]